MLPSNDTTYLAERAVIHSIIPEANMTCVVFRDFSPASGL